ncbi:MAG TPA: dihydrolipoamide acetyltransferase family protein [Steroidobacteraceae bacterium]|nr:dihydrolipoamide acetyltransferase family protein [Steroidobacteraceae bacterium]
MSRYVFKLPDLGEGAVDAEIVAWRVSAGEEVREDQPLVEMLTQKATVEVPAPVTGRVLSTTGGPGERVAVGAELAVFETDAEARAAAAQPATAAPPKSAPAAPAASAPAAVAETAADPRRVATSPAIRRRARDAGIDLTTIAGSGPHGRVVLQDLEARLQAGRVPARDADEGGPDIREIPVIGLRRLIAEQVAASARDIPHFAYVEEVDMTALESLRQRLNAETDGGVALTYLPFIVRGLIRALARHPQCNARYDAARQLLLQHRAVHVGIAVQTPQGLKVPVVRDAQKLSLREIDAEIRRLSAAARDGRARPQELTGSTITVTSLGKLGGIASTPIINQPELAIIGINRAVERPVVQGNAIVIRRMMNLSSSFDHRFIDGFDAARLIQSLREGLEQPALLFM